MLLKEAQANCSNAIRPRADAYDTCVKREMYVGAKSYCQKVEKRVNESLAACSRRLLD